MDLDLEDSNSCKSQQRLEGVGNSSLKFRGETLDLLRYSMWLCVLGKFLGYNPCIDEVDEGKENESVDGTIF